MPTEQLGDALHSPIKTIREKAELRQAFFRTYLGDFLHDGDVVLDANEEEKGVSRIIVRDKDGAEFTRAVPVVLPDQVPPEFSGKPKNPKVEIQLANAPKFGDAEAARSKRGVAKRGGQSSQTNFVGQFDASEPPPPMPTLKPDPSLYTSTEGPTESMHQMMNRKKGGGQALGREVQRDESKARRDFLKAIGALTQAERMQRLRTVYAPLELKLFQKAGLFDLFNQPITNAIVQKIAHKEKELRALAKTPEFEGLRDQLKEDFNYWLLLKRLTDKSR